MHKIVFLAPLPSKSHVLKMESHDTHYRLIIYVVVILEIFPRFIIYRWQAKCASFRIYKVSLKTLAYLFSLSRRVPSSFNRIFVLSYDLSTNIYVHIEIYICSTHHGVAIMNEAVRIRNIGFSS